MFCTFVNDDNNILFLVNQVTAVEDIVSITKQSLKTKYILFLCRPANVAGNLIQQYVIHFVYSDETALCCNCLHMLH
jgi:hypothetical protein